jgi:hypothetical protein
LLIFEANNFISIWNRLQTRKMLYLANDIVFKLRNNFSWAEITNRRTGREGHYNNKEKDRKMGAKVAFSLQIVNISLSMLD